MPNDTAYFDSQASAAATLKIDIRDIREAKKAGCPAFRSGRVYEKPLVKWLAHNKSKRTKRKIDSPDDEPRHALCEAMISLAKRFDGGLITTDEYFDRCERIIAAFFLKPFFAAPHVCEILNFMGTCFSDPARENDES